MPLKFIVPRDLKSRSMKSKHRKTKVLIGAVIARAQEMGLWDEHNGSWDIPKAMRLYDSVCHLFFYPSRTHSSIQRNDQISWKTVYNLYPKNRDGLGCVCGCGRGCGHERNWEDNSVGIGDDAWMNEIEGLEA